MYHISQAGGGGGRLKYEVSWGTKCHSLFGVSCEAWSIKICNVIILVFWIRIDSVSAIGTYRVPLHVDHRHAMQGLPNLCT